MRRSANHLRPAILLAIIAGLVAALGWGSAPLVLAHASLVRAEPSPNSVLSQSPDRVTIWFTEPMVPGLSTIQVLDSQGQRVDRGDSIVDGRDPTVMSVTLPPLPNGTYTVAWKNVSTVDGHAVRGSFVFSIGEPISGAPTPSQVPKQPLLLSPAQPVLRWLVLLSALALVGGLGFELLVAQPVLAGSSASENLERLGQQLGRRTLKLLWLAMVLLLLASLGQLILQTSAAYDIPLSETLGRPIANFIGSTGWGRFWLWRVGLLLIVAGIIGLSPILRSREPGRQDTVPFSAQLAQVLALGVSAGLLLTLSLTSHGAATRETRSAAVFSDYLHLLAAGFWVGGLFHFALAVPLVMRTLSPVERRATLAVLVPRFSTLATLSVGTLIITGIYSGWAQVTVVSAVDTPYGLTLLAKLGLVAPLLLLGALNLLWVRPRLAKEEMAGRRLSRLVLGEALLALLVLASVGVLTSLEPARQAASRKEAGLGKGLTFQGVAEGANIYLDITPGRVGVSRIGISLRDRLGNPITNATGVDLSFTYLGADLGETTASAIPAGEGKYVLEKVLLTIAGPWQVGLVVRRPDAFDARTAFRFEVASGGAAGSAAIAPDAGTGRLLWGVELVLLGSLFFGAGMVLGGAWTRQGAVITGTGLVSAVVGLVLLFNIQLARIGASELRPLNPFPPNPASLEAGRQVYQQNCQVCHGAKGRGDGPRARSLNPPPLDLAVHAPLHADGDLFRFIQDGISGTAMAPWRGKLTDDETWHVVNYIKGLK